ncbi:MAG: hypothetical protein ACOCWO_00200, partial [Candidatus Muiribacteriaceae bacterium]
RINTLLKDLEQTDGTVKDNYDRIQSLITKNWYLNSEFEKDRNVMLQLLRNTLDQFSNMNDRLHALELELFNPEELGFDAMYDYLDKAVIDMNQAYRALDQGKSGLKTAKEAFAKSKVAYARVTSNLTNAIDHVMNAVPYNPPAPQPDPEPVVESEPTPPEIDYDKLDVYIENKKVDVNEFQVINSNSYEGKLVLKKSKERLHELSSVDRWMYREALKNKDGFSFLIAKLDDNYYTVFWWHVGDDVADIVDTIEDIFN